MLYCICSAAIAEFADVQNFGVATSAKGIAVPFSTLFSPKTKYAPVMELVDMRDLGAVTTEKVFENR